MSLNDSLKRASAKPQWKRRPEVLLCGNVPRPMHGVNPRTILGPIWWNKTRQAAYKSTGFHCIACGTWKLKAKGRQWLEGHELYDIDYLLGRMVYMETVPLCHYCHQYIHSGRMEALVEKGQMQVSSYRAITQHGDRVLAEAGLKRPPVYDGPFAEWADWRLVLDGKEYPPVFKDCEEWEASYG